MAQTTTTKRINLYQLGQALGFPPLRLRGDARSTSNKTVLADIPQTTLDAAVEAHTADFSVQPPTPTRDVEQGDARTRLRNSYTALRQWAADAAVVAAQGTNVTQAQNKALFDRFGKLADGLADLLVTLSIDRD